MSRGGHEEVQNIDGLGECMRTDAGRGRGGVGRGIGGGREGVRGGGCQNVNCCVCNFGKQRERAVVIVQERGKKSVEKTMGGSVGCG